MRTNELELMLDAVRTVSSDDDLDVVLNELARLLAKAVNVPSCRVALLANGDRDLVLRARYSSLTTGAAAALGIAYPNEFVYNCLEILVS